MTTAPRVLFVCVRNRGKSQLAAGLMRRLVQEHPQHPVTVVSAGTRAGTDLNTEAVQSLLEVGVDITGQHPQQLTDDLLHDADLVVVLGSEARVDPAGGVPVEVWETDEPSARGIEGAERMRLVRDDVAARVRDLHTRLASG
ncbi:low molecular weight phosphatase family protein [Kineococcus rhizosphaerae]|uniref:Arsenate-mycothiol transferase n=1 Tax=Kineococcus rhizosphaerae TaxID=559628 RepID=A0A2T0QXK1_9ACTN|nr:low molecular weight phosphatase family protein [Kineococcus rhizosphaerae]PRY10778.1 arsenate-mycothiol transferase [Kineococcus rhizosphaerae]